MVLTKIFRDEILTVVHDENTSNVQLNVVLHLTVLKQVKGSTFWDKEKGAEFKLTFD